MITIYMYGTDYDKYCPVCGMQLYYECKYHDSYACTDCNATGYNYEPCYCSMEEYKINKKNYPSRQTSYISPWLEWENAKR